MLESKGIYFKELYKETTKIFKHNQIISYLITNEKFNLIVSIRPSGNISKWLITKIKTYSEGTKKSPEFSSHKVCLEIKGTSNHLTFLMTVNEVYHKLKLISTIGLLIYPITHTVFYQNFGFPYTQTIRIVCFRTCSNTLVPTYNYLSKVILVHSDLFY